jgi:hypothetical protein
MGWRRQLLEQTRDTAMALTQGYYGIFHLVAYFFRLEVRLKDKSPGIGTSPHTLTKFGLASQA